MTNDQNVVVLPEMTELWQQTLNWQPDLEQQQLFQKLYEGILSGNRQLNLTRITGAEEFWEKHLWDSLVGLAPIWQSVTPGQRIIDIGTGAGFPGLPVAIAFPNTAITLLDSTRKKITFLQTLIPQLEINNVKTLVGRAEAIGQKQQHRHSYDIALVRAVSAPSVCAEYALPLLKKGGLAILYRGHWTDEETEALQPAVKKLGGKIESVEKFTTPLSDSVRHCLFLKVLSPTVAKFPRAIGLPAQEPLN